MTDIIILIHHVAFDYFVWSIRKYAHISDSYRLLVFFLSVFQCEVFFYRSVIDEHIVDFIFSYVFLDDIHKVFYLEIVCLPVLGHDIANIDDFCLRLLYCFSHTLSKQVWNDARIEIPGTDDDIIRVDQNFLGAGIELSAADQECIADFEITVVFWYIYIGFTDYLGSVFEYDSELGIIEGNGDNFSAHLKHLGELLNAFFKIPGYIRECREEEISDGVTCYPVSCFEPVLEKAPDDSCVLREGDNRTTDIPGGEYPELVADLPGASARIGNRYNGSKVVVFVLLETIEDIESSRSSSDGGDVGFHYFLTLRVDCIRLYRFYILINLFMDGTTLIILLIILAVVIPMFIKKVSQGEL